MNIKIIGSGSYIPTRTVKNIDFSDHTFLDELGAPLPHSSDVIISKLKDITGISERRYVEPQLVNSDIAFFAAEKAIADAGIDPETLDYIIVAQNYGDVVFGSNQSDSVPSIASRVKNKLRISNPGCAAFDVVCGCPGWIQGVLQANAFIKAGMAKRCLVIGSETLSRVVDPHDRDSMIYSDGAGATVLEGTTKDEGLLSFQSATYSYDESNFLFFGFSFNRELENNTRYIKMYGRKIYEFALKQVPQAMKDCLEKSGYGIDDVKKILIHQANEKMDEAIVSRFYKLFKKTPPELIMPMSIRKLGNSSVATVPTLYDMLVKGDIENHSLNKGDVIIFASVGAGMNINAIVYKY